LDAPKRNNVALAIGIGSEGLIGGGDNVECVGVALRHTDSRSQAHEDEIGAVQVWIFSERGLMERWRFSSHWD
jgi:hypothetical protein